MSDYISREAVLNHYRVPDPDGTFVYCRNLLDYVQNLPASDVVEREHLGEQIYRAVHSAGGCDASSDYDRGYDDGIAAALEEITRLTGIDENCLDEEDEDNE